MPMEVPPTELGNVWIIAATLAMNLMGRQPQAVVIDSEGTLRGISPSSEQFKSVLMDPGYVCTLDQSSDVRRIAAQIRKAALAVEPPG